MCSKCISDIANEAVSHPQHYGGEDDQYEVIKVAEAWGFDKNAYLFNVLKYIRREKGHTLEDLKKARWYLDRLISRLENTEHLSEEPEFTKAMLHHNSQVAKVIAATSPPFGTHLGEGRD